MTDDVLTVSHSQLGVWNRCSFKWDLHYQKGWRPKAQPDYFARGSLIHGGLETYYRALQQGQLDVGDDSIMESLTQRWVADQAASLEMINKVSLLLARYIRDFSLFEDKNIEIVEIEKQYTVDLETPTGRPYKFTMILDLLVKAGGKYFVMDHKSSGGKPGKDALGLDLDVQLPTQAYVLSKHPETGIDVDGLVFNFLNTYPYKDLRNTPVDKLFKRSVTYRTEHEMQVMIDEIGRAVDHIYQDRDATRRSFAFDCDRCNMAELCLLDMKGVDLTREQPVNFRNVKRTDVQVPSV